MKNDDKPTKFEVYVENLFRGRFGYKTQRNVLFIRKDEKTQIDLIVQKLLFKGFYELKYSSSGIVGAVYGKNPVDQVLRASRVSGLRNKGIITNGYFSKSLADYAKKKGVKLYDVSYLIALEDERLSLDGRGWATLNFGSLERKIKRVQNRIGKIDLGRYDLGIKTIYV